MFNIVQYKKSNHASLFEKLSSMYDMSQLQNYIPIYNSIFLLNENNFNKITLNTNETLLTLSSSADFNREDIYIKFAPIMDPFRFIMGKYSQYTDEIFCLPTYYVIVCLFLNFTPEHQTQRVCVNHDLCSVMHMKSFRHLSSKYQRKSFSNTL